jgi:hypothetical protein
MASVFDEAQISYALEKIGDLFASLVLGQIPRGATPLLDCVIASPSK